MDQKQFFFYWDQNLNEAYLQGRVSYLSFIVITGEKMDNNIFIYMFYCLSNIFGE